MNAMSSAAQANWQFSPPERGRNAQFSEKESGAKGRFWLVVKVSLILTGGA